MPFIGGIHPIYNKITRKNKIEVAPLPKKVILPLQQHTGAPCEPLVKAEDIVKVGQKIAEAKAFVSAPIHASISGKVLGIAKSPHPVLGECNSIIIESFGKIEWDESVKRRDNVDNLTKDELKNYTKLDIITIAIMILGVMWTFSIDRALLFGFVIFILGLIITKKFKEINPYMIISTILLIIGFLLSIYKF